MANMIQNNFVAGEISPALYGRSDLQAYYHACASCKNFIVSKEGSLKKRRGIVTQGAVSYQYSVCKVIPYIYDRDEGGIITFYLLGTKIKAELRSKDNFDLCCFYTTIYEPEEGEPSATAEHVKSIRCSQIGDTIFANAKGLFNKKLTVDWSQKTFAVENYQQRQQPATVTSITAVPTGLTGTPKRTLTYGAYVVRDGIISEVTRATCEVKTTWTAGGYVTVTVTHGQDLETKDFDYILIGKKSGSFFGELARFYPEDVTETTVSFQDENHTPSDVIYSQTNVLGNNFQPPLLTGAFQQRLCFANGNSNSNNLPMTLWFSAIGNLYSFYADRPAADDDPFSPTLMSTGPSFIRWLVPYQKTMIVFTDAGIFSISGSQNEGFSASTCQINKLSNISVSQDVQPIETEAGIVFVGADGKTLYTLAYDLQSDSTRPINRMMMAKHITRSASITSIALQQYPDQVIWCCLSDGTLASFTFEKDEEVYAWSRHTSDVLYFQAVVGIGTVTDSSTDHTYGDVIFLCRKTAAPAGFYLATFANDFNDAISGYGGSSHAVEAELVTLPAESTQETIAFRNKNAKDILIRLFESGPIKVMPYGSGLAEQTIVTGNTPYTGDKKVKPLGYVSDLGQMRFKSDTNANANILAIVTKMEVD